MTAFRSSLRRPAGRRVWIALVTVLAVLLPAWAAGAHLDAPPAYGETTRLAAGIDPEAAPLPRSLPALMYYGATAPESGDASAQLARARFANLPAMIAIAGLLYLTLALVRRRASGVLACVVLALLPPVAVEGYVLRPEVPAAVFGGLAVLLVVGFPVVVRRSRAVAAAVASMVVTGVTLGLAVATLPTAGIFMLVPAFAFALALLTAARSAPRLVRRHRLLRRPLAALQARTLPWLGLSLASLIGPTLLQPTFVEGTVADLGATASHVGLLPREPFAKAALILLAVLGGARLVLAVSQRLGPWRRVPPIAVVLIYAVALVARSALMAGPFDRLPAAPAMAVLVAEGAVGVVLLAVGVVSGRPRG